MLIPGQDQLFSGSEGFPKSIMMLMGASGSGKTAYTIQFLKDGMAIGDECLYLNCSQALTEHRFNSYFANPKTGTKAPIFVSLFQTQEQPVGRIELSDLLNRLRPMLQTDRSTTRVVLDCLTDLIARLPNEAVHRFVAELYDLLKAKNVIALFAIAGNPSVPIVDTLGSLVDGIIQLRREESGDEVQRSARLLCLKTAHNVPKWVRFRIKLDGNIEFPQDNEDSRVDAECKLCGGPIVGGGAHLESGSSFHPHCLDTYRKLGEIYGSHTLYALQPGVVNGHFFFIDIVGLSNPLLSVERQIGKIEGLNALIGSCDAFTKVPRDKKIVLPTGDGMAIGFLINPELPFQLSMQLHRKLHAFNTKAIHDSTIGVRIGLSSGPVFVVSDINNNQNVWGPGIIVARRVMDLGEDGHILLADNLAEALINLKDEYRQIIRPIGNGYIIKHGQRLKIYSAYSDDFGNAAIPARLSESS